MRNKGNFLTHTLVSFLMMAITIFILSCGSHKEQEKYNILFVAVDDLRTELGCYGNSEIKSPNIDKLASQGITFKRAYCQQPICMASRASLMSGLRPDTLQIYNCASINELAPNVLTLNRHFENNGYRIWSSGKIYHHNIDHELQFGEHRVQPTTNEIGRGYLSSSAVKTVEEYDAYYLELTNQSGGGRGPAFESPDVADNAYYDGAMTELAIRQLAEYKSSEAPFFMAVGYHKPHLPFNAPKKYWDMYDPNGISMADNPYLPENVSEFFHYNFGELRNYAGIPKGNELLSDSLSRTLKHGYYACVSYIDAQIGRLLEGLKANGLADNTIVILWGDHGWKLGEHGMWCKHTQFELDSHVPMILKVPGQKNNGTVSDAIVEFVDIYPTLSELTGLEIPAHVQGTSFMPVIQDPVKAWKDGAITLWPLNRNNPDKLVLGFSLQTSRYRYTEWVKGKTGEVLARDLFDHQLDPDENTNISLDPENKKIIDKLSQLLQKGKGWRTIRDDL